MRLSHLLPLVGILLVGCTTVHAPGESLLPEEVLQRTASESQKLDSSQYLITADFDMDSGNTWTAEGVVRMDGIIQHAGKQVRFQTDVTAEITDSTNGDSTIDGTVEVVVMGKDEVYLNIHSLTSQPNSALFQPDVIGKLAGTWWQLPSQDAAPQSTTVTPDPRLLQAQASVITVIADKGITEFNGKMSYHYVVELDKEKLFSYLEALKVETDEVRASLKDTVAEGEIWIDAETFYVQKVLWNISSLHTSAQATLDTSLTLTFRNQNAAPTIEPPVGAVQFTPAVLFALPPDALFNEER
ncbi:MAG: hypothetical protein KC680_02745 [Candidatus Peregrinibacteria bacterium]|nr:hypothetical protein [Candidatus Peregrinibacteria bacterium]MCB9808547.1 hypothetical protein [Candidatus Peribacteria bacterium]